MRSAAVVAVGLMSLLAVPALAGERGAHRMHAHRTHLKSVKSETAEEARVDAGLVAAFNGDRVSLVSALNTGELNGRPIAGQFEFENGNLQLSIFTLKDGMLYDVIVDDKTGNVVRTDPVTGGEELAYAKRQAELMGGTKASLSRLVARAESAHPGYRAVCIEAGMDHGRTDAIIALLKGTEPKYVKMKL